MGYAVTRMYHPSHRVPDLDEAERFFATVFGRSSFTLAEYLGYGGREINPRYPTDYSIFTPIADVLFDCIDPARYVYDGVQRYESVDEPQLSGLGWFVEGIDELWTVLCEHGIRGTDQRNVLPEPGEIPRGYLGETPLIFTLAADSGLRYEFAPRFDHPLDPRSDPSWTVPATLDGDPLGIEFCSHHTILTDQPERATKVLVTILCGQVLCQQTNQLLDTESTYVRIQDSIFEIAVPLDAASSAAEALRRCPPDDAYYTLTWKVTDLERAASHLRACGLAIRTETETAVVVEPAAALGIPWVFTTDVLRGDPRRGDLV